jgi:hypothetical protein
MSQSVKLKELVSSSDDFNIANINSILCCVCNDIAQSPVRCKDCKIIYCQDCADIQKNQRKKCEGHNKIFYNYYQDEELETTINTKLSFFCKNKNQGCNYVCNNISDIAFHLIDCNLLVMACHNENCSFSGTQDQLNNHLPYCEFSDTKCSVCNSIVKKDQLPFHNCMIKIVQELTEMQESIEVEKQKLNYYLTEKTNALVNLCDKYDLLPYFCNMCKKEVKWIGDYSKLPNYRSYISCLNKKGIHNKNIRFICEGCLISYCTECAKIIKVPKNNKCICGQQMIKRSIPMHCCDICSKQIQTNFLNCSACIFDICEDCEKSLNS